MVSYCFVFDGEGKKLSPTNENKGWYLIRKGKATLVSKCPMVIQLNRVLEEADIDETPIRLGIDDGSKHVGIGLVQECKNRNKVIFKGVLEHRNDVSKKIELRRGYRRYRRSHKRYRKARFDNRGSSRRKGRIAPSIKQKRDTLLRVVNKLNNWVRINKVILEDVQFDIRSITEGYSLYRWEYQKSNRLDENIRKATLMRDNFSCMDCGKRNCILEVHHIVPRRLSGADSIYNLITLCSSCHEKVTGNELIHKNRYFDLIKGKSVNTQDAQHVMQGKRYLQEQLSKIAELELTNGGITANRRIDLGIEKSHSNDALVISGLKICTEEIEIIEWVIKPIRKKKKSNVEELMGIRHRDYVRYTKRNGDYYEGYITSLLPKNNQCNIKLLNGKVLMRYGLKNVKILNRFRGLYWI